MQTKISLVRDILNKLYEEKNFEKLVKAGLEMICAVINAEQAAVAFQENGEFIEYLFNLSSYIELKFEFNCIIRARRPSSFGFLIITDVVA